MANAHTLFITNDAQLAKALTNSYAWFNCIYLRDVALEWLEQNFSGRCITNSSPITVTKTSPGLSGGVTLATELCSIKPDVTAQWGCILTDAFVAAAALNEPCLFFLLIKNKGGTSAIEEVLFWHDGLNNARPIKRAIKYVKEFMEWNRDKNTGITRVNPDKELYVFCFTSINREQTRQTQPNFATKTPHQKTTDAWNGYLTPLWQFRELLNIPQTTWLHCEDGVARKLDVAATFNFLNQAKNVLGWKEEQ